MQLDFSGDPVRSWYAVLLLISGLAMLAMGLFGSKGLSTGWRIANGLFGLGFFGYGIYLAFLFHGGSYWIFFKVLFLPVIMIINFFRSLSMRQKTKVGYGQQPPAGPPQGYPAGYAAPPAPGGYAAPPAGGYGAPAPGGYAAPPAPGGYAAPATGGYAAPAPGAVPPPPGYGYPQQGGPGYGAPGQPPAPQG